LDFCGQVFTGETQDSEHVDLALFELLSTEFHGVGTARNRVGQRAFAFAQVVVIGQCIFDILERAQGDADILRCGGFLLDLRCYLVAQLDLILCDLLGGIDGIRSDNAQTGLIARFNDIDPEQITRAFLAIPEWSTVNAIPFMHTVIPNLRNLGLITERTEGSWRRVGMMVESAPGVKGAPVAAAS